MDLGSKLVNLIRRDAMGLGRCPKCGERFKATAASARPNGLVTYIAECRCDREALDRIRQARKQRCR